MIDRLTAKLEGLERRHDELTDQMAQPDVATDYERVQTLTKERSSLDRLVSLYREYKKTAQELSEARQLIAGGDHELSALAKEEVGTLERQLSQLTDDIHIALLPTDPNDEKSVIVEIRAGAGGDEAALFGADLFRMYSRYATLHSWGVDIIEKNETGIGGIKEIIFEVSGKGAYSRLKHESGVHRVQRVPSTESSGRIHTSAATVARTSRRSPPPCAPFIFPPALPPSAKMNGRSSRTRLRPWRCCGPASMTSSRRNRPPPLRKSVGLRWVRPIVRKRFERTTSPRIESRTTGLR